MTQMTPVGKRASQSSRIEGHTNAVGRRGQLPSPALLAGEGSGEGTEAARMGGANIERNGSPHPPPSPASNAGEGALPNTDAAPVAGVACDTSTAAFLVGVP